MTETYEDRPRTGGDYEPLGAAQPAGQKENALRLRAGSATVEVAALAPDLFRVGAFFDGRPPEYASEAVAAPEGEPVPVSVHQRGEGLALSTPEAEARISLSPLRMSFADSSGRTFCADDPELGMGVVRGGSPAGDPVALYKRREEGERYFGCGERTSGLEKTGSYQVFWNVDPPAGHTAAFNNLYTSIPFLLSLRGGRAYGLLFDNTRRVEFDLAREDPARIRLGAEGGDIVYYVFCGPTPRRVLERYTWLTGRTPMPPLWALGNQQSRWSYADEEEVRRISRAFRERDIPCDVLYLDIDYMDGYRVFTWDRDRFPDPRGLISELGEEGFRVVAIVDPGVKVDENYPVYTEGRENGFYCLTPGGEEYRNAVWPGVCAFPDFTSARVREWWGGNHRALLDEGVSGVWCDMNEPSLFIPEHSTMPPDVVHPGDGRPRLHGEVHNTYGSLMARAAREGLLGLRPGERPFVITRAGYAGLQRHALQWTGDNSSWWEHLWMAMPQLQNLGLSGVAFCGVDVGGFFGDCDGELLARFTEFGVLQPFCRNHSAKGTVPQEPWAFGEPYESVCRKMIKLRYRLLPYLYTLFEECHRTGAPILRPLLFEFPEDETTYAADDEFMLGGALLAAPITRPGIEHRHVYLPEGTWFHFWSGERFEGPAHILAHAPLGEPALYARANAALPLGPEKSHTGERPAEDSLTLLIHAAEGSGSSALYEDEGDGFAYREGVYARREISCRRAGGRITVRLGEREGSYDPGRREVVLDVRGIRGARRATVNGEERPLRLGEGRVAVALEERPGETVVEIEAT
ncbi:Alpha-glucosidase [Rubrobacter xylanophilus DSM 9941]|uniref:Alpha-glucosidase n=1 Tax=Rubrobacter xylanophilus (strain DSM 9941 / JCM 11954 / NBRC 16129 / PRD-1) TaxID=266117 RepID=Q1AU85_RUBXD|nr:glycoside hydrolase family 31 protein [Rubrobacter xylanophilus]ABG05043.1 Alpha-glucosidase [Rubrobacter xylanophilus DSM 9941]